MMQEVYKKSMRIPKSTGASSGQITNLFSSDTQLIFDGMQNIIPGIISPFQLLGAIILLGFYIDYYCLIPVATFFLFLPIAVILGAAVGLRRRAIQQYGDIRLKLTTEVIQVN